MINHANDYNIILILLVKTILAKGRFPELLELFLQGNEADVLGERSCKLWLQHIMAVEDIL